MAVAVGVGECSFVRRSPLVKVMMGADLSVSVGGDAAWRRGLNKVVLARCCLVRRGCAKGKSYLRACPSVVSNHVSALAAEEEPVLGRTLAEHVAKVR